MAVAQQDRSRAHSFGIPHRAEDRVGQADHTELAGFKTVENAITTTIKKAAVAQVGSPGYLGVLVEEKGGKLIVGDVEAGSPAEAAGLKSGDVVAKVDSKAVKTSDIFRSLLQMKTAGESIQLTVNRGKENAELSATLIATSRAMQIGQKRAILGVQVEDATDEGASLKSVTAGSPADKAGLKAGDVIVKIDGKALTGAVKLNDITAQHKPGDTLTLLVMPKGEEDSKEVRVTLAAEEPGGPAKGKGKGKGGDGSGFGWDTRAPRVFTKDTYRLAIVGIEFPDVKAQRKNHRRRTGKNPFSAPKPTTPPASPAKKSSAA